jgi:hypothetical protein
MKAPGTFYLASWLAGPEATDVARFMVWANVWALASLLGVAVIGWRLWGPASAVAAAAVYGLHDAFLDTMDANYVTWAQLPTVLAAVWAVEALRTRSTRRMAVAWLVAGTLAGLAALLKRPNGVVAIGLLLGACALPYGLDETATARPRSERGRAVGFATLGVLLAHLPIALDYALAGQLPALWSGYVFSERGFAYATHGSASLAASALVEGPLAAAHFLVLPLCLAAFCLWPPPSRRDRATLGWLVGYLVFALLAASIGFRFYKGYFLAALAPASLLAAAPWGLLGRARGMGRAAQAIALVPVALLVGRQVLLLDGERTNRAQPHDLGGRAIAKHVRAYSPPGERVWVWGWHLWDVYPYTGMLSGSRLYKSVSMITTPNDSTWRRPRQPMHFVEGPMSDLLLADLDRTRPYFIVLGGSVSVPRREFTALRAFLAAHYRIDRRTRLGRVQFWRRAEPVANQQGDP